jgi:DNA-binding NarL/FixJ family response regulator
MAMLATAGETTKARRQASSSLRLTGTDPIDQAAELAREGVKEARAAVGALRAPQLRGVDDLRGLVEGFPADASLNVTGHPGRLSPEAGHAVYRAAPAGAVGLTCREADVVRLVAQGLNNRQVARELVVSEATVKTHLNHILAKLVMQDRAALIAWAWRHGLVGADH